MSKNPKALPQPTTPMPEVGDTFDQCELTAKQKDLWYQSMSLLQWTAPGFKHLFYKMLAPNAKGEYGALMTNAIPIAATDGQSLLLNPERFFKYNISEQAFIIAHEVGHNMYGDVEYIQRCAQANEVIMEDGTKLPFSEQIMQQALDFRLNALLVESRIGDLPRNIDNYPLCYDTKIAMANDSRTEVYKKLFKKYEQEGKIQYIPNFDMVLKPGKGTPDKAPRNEEQWAVEMQVAKQLEQFSQSGKMADALKRAFEKLLNPEIPWTDYIRGIMIRSFGDGSYNWRRPDRRFIVRDIAMPSRSGNGTGWLVVWGDTSGSISNPELCRYMAELSGIVEDCKPARLTVLWCDSQIRRIDEVEDVSDLARIHAEGVGGGGGTSVQPVFEWIKDQMELPEMMVAFTDGLVSFPRHAPVFPVIWAMTTEVKAPWGQMVRLKHGNVR